MSNDTYQNLMSDEFCQTPQYLGSLDEVKAVRKAMALRCLEQGRKIILIRRLSMDDVKVICDGKEELFTPWQSPKGKRLQFEAEVKNILDGTSEKQTFDLMPERTALLDGGIVIEGVDEENVPYTISEFDFSQELYREWKKRGMLPKKSAAEAKEKARLAREKREQFEKEQAEYNEREVQKALDAIYEPFKTNQVEYEPAGSSSDWDDDDKEYIGLFERYDPSEPKVRYSDPEYGYIYEK